MSKEADLKRKIQELENELKRVKRQTRVNVASDAIENTRNSFKDGLVKQFIEKFSKELENCMVEVVSKKDYNDELSNPMQYGRVARLFRIQCNNFNVSCEGVNQFKQMKLKVLEKFSSAYYVIEDWITDLSSIDTQTIIDDYRRDANVQNFGLLKLLQSKSFFPEVELSTIVKHLSSISYIFHGMIGSALSTYLGTYIDAELECVELSTIYRGLYPQI